MEKKKLIRTHDNLVTLDAASIEAASVFFLGELELHDPRINMPLQSFSWSRDMPIRSDVTIADEITSYARDFFAAPGNQEGDGTHFIGANTTQIAGPQVTRNLYRNPLEPWGMEISYTIFDIEKSMKVGRPINTAKIDAVQRIYQQEMNDLAYKGNSRLGFKGLFNLDDITISSASTKTSGGTIWTVATDPDEILADINALILSTLQSTNETIAPSRILIPWTNYNIIATRKISLAGERTILTFLKENNISNAVIGRELEILPVRWLDTAGVGGLGRMIAYTPDEQYLRMPVVPLLRTPLEQTTLYFKFVYYTVCGGVENVYPETIGYMDGI